MHSLAKVVAVVLMFSQVFTPLAFAAKKRTPANEPECNSDSLVTELVSAGAKAEQLGARFSNDRGQLVDVRTLIESRAELVRILVPATADGTPSFGFVAKRAKADPGDGVLRIAMAAYDSKFEKRLSMRLIEVNSKDDPTEVRLRFEQTAQSMATEVLKQLTGQVQGASGKLYAWVGDLLVPQAQAAMTMTAFVFSFHLTAAIFHWIRYVERRSAGRLFLAGFFTFLAATFLDEMFRGTPAKD